MKRLVLLALLAVGCGEKPRDDTAVLNAVAQLGEKVDSGRLEQQAANGRLEKAVDGLKAVDESLDKRLKKVEADALAIQQIIGGQIEAAVAAADDAHTAEQRDLVAAQEEARERFAMAPPLEQESVRVGWAILKDGPLDLVRLDYRQLEALNKHRLAIPGLDRRLKQFLLINADKRLNPRSPADFPD